MDTVLLSAVLTAVAVFFGLLAIFPGRATLLIGGAAAGAWQPAPPPSARQAD